MENQSKPKNWDETQEISHKEMLALAHSLVKGLKEKNVDLDEVKRTLCLIDNCYDNLRDLDIMKDWKGRVYLSSTGRLQFRLDNEEEKDDERK